MKRIFLLFAPYRGRLAAISLLIVVLSFTGIAIPLLAQVMIDDGLLGPGGPDVALLAKVFAAMAAVSLVTALLSVLEAYLTYRTGHAIMEELRMRVYSHLQRMSMSFFTRTRTGEIQSRLADDVGDVHEVVGTTIPAIVAAVVTTVTTLVTMLAVSWRLTLVSVALLPLVSWATVKLGDYQRGLVYAVQNTRAEMSVIAEETLSVSGILLAKVFGRQDYGLARFREQSRQLSGLQLKAALAAQAMNSTFQGLFALTPAAIYLGAGFGDPLSYGQLAAFTALQARLFFPVGRLLQITVQVRSSAALFDRIHEYLDLAPEVTDAPWAVDVPAARVRGEVRLARVSFAYSDALVVDDVDLTIGAGQFAAIVGASGSGKSTLAHLLLRLYDPDRGAVLIDGRDVRGMSAASLTAMFGVVTQETHLFHSSIADNVRFGRPGASDAEVEWACRMAQLHERIARLPGGYTTVVGERGFHLSGGEKQRLAIARAILRNPRILLLDEATSALDPENERLIQAALRPLSAGRTTIAIAHRLSTVVSADVIFVLDRGRLVERGTHAQLMALGRRYASLYNRQAQAGTLA